jgi:hypothetical protein
VTSCGSFTLLALVDSMLANPVHILAEVVEVIDLGPEGDLEVAVGVKQYVVEF